MIHKALDTVFWTAATVGVYFLNIIVAYGIYFYDWWRGEPDDY